MADEKRACVTVRISISIDGMPENDVSVTGGYDIDHERYTRENAIADTVLAAMRGFAGVDGDAGYGRPEWILQDCLKRYSGGLDASHRDGSD